MPFSAGIELPEPHRDTTRKIIHIDMDAFFSSVEERDCPSLRGKPVIIAKHPRKTGGKGIVATANYVARQYGIRSAMSAYEAYKRCPEGIFIEGNFSAYREASLQIRDIMHRYTDLVEPMSIDEAYLDVTENKLNIKSATLLAKNIQQDIWRETRLTSSAGVSYNKFIAKIASDYRKPAGLTVITPEQALAFIHQLPIEKFPGIGPKTSKKMHELKIYTGADLYQMEQLDLIHHFGKAGISYYRKARGIDNKPLNLQRERKSVGKEHTYFQPLTSEAAVLKELRRLAKEVEAVLERHGKQCKTIVVKIRYRSFETLTRQTSFTAPIRDSADIYSYAAELWDKFGQVDREIRLLGVTATKLEPVEHQMISLFPYHL